LRLTGTPFRTTVTPIRSTDGPDMTDNQINKIRQAIAECDRFIASEERRDTALRPADVQKHLDFCKTHRVKLLGML
jgi:hypothetical protein